MKLRRDKLPQHVVITLDGNRRWAKKQGLPALAGHKRVVEKVIEPLIERAGTLGIPYITFWAWSTENWNRGKMEVAGIMRLFRMAQKVYSQRLIAKGARLKVIGDIGAFPKDIQEGMREDMERSKHNTKITVTFALNYGGRDEIVRALNALRESRIKNHESWENLITEAEFERYLDTAGMPDPDLMIRPGGERRLSGLLPWQSVYAELYFTDVLMPDFTVAEFDKALLDYQRRERRFGGGFVDSR